MAGWTRARPHVDMRCLDRLDLVEKSLLRNVGTIARKQTDRCCATNGCIGQKLSSARFMMQSLCRSVIAHGVDGSAKTAFRSTTGVSTCYA
eukprot:scaffold431_cov334-Pavlova_lutheri.AAC.63